MNPPTVISREAEAAGFIHLKSSVIRMIKENEDGKGNVIAQAEKAGIEVVNKAGNLIPCMPSAESATVCVRSWIFPNGIEVKSIIRSHEPSSIESEALMSVFIALVTIYELCRALDTSIVISDIRLLRIV